MIKGQKVKFIHEGCGPHKFGVVVSVDGDCVLVNVDGCEYDLDIRLDCVEAV